MDQQIGDRVATLETDVAVIQSNYVRKDAFEALRAEVGIGFAKADAKADSNYARLDAKIDRVQAELSTEIQRAVATMLRWTFGLQLSIAALAIAAFKYL